MLVVTSFVGIPMCYTFPRIILVTRDLGRIAKSGVNHENWLTCL
jgi:hypothetical protein